MIRNTTWELLGFDVRAMENALGFHLVHVRRCGAFPVLFPNELFCRGYRRSGSPCWDTSPAHGTGFRLHTCTACTSPAPRQNRHPLQSWGCVWHWTWPTRWGRCCSPAKTTMNSNIFAPCSCNVRERQKDLQLWARCLPPFWTPRSGPWCWPPRSPEWWLCCPLWCSSQTRRCWWSNIQKQRRDPFTETGTS